MKKFFCVILAFSFLLVANQVFAESGRESKYQPPHEVEIMYATEGWAYQAKDINDVIRFKVLPDGSMAVYDSSGNTIYSIAAGITGIADLSGTTAGPVKQSVALLSGSTGTLSWAASSSGASGWHLTEALLKRYTTFDVETSFPGGLVTGATQYSDKGSIGIAKTGETIYLTGCLVSAVHGMRWQFTHRHGGTTPFVLYDANGRFNGGSGTTENPAGDTTVRTPEDLADSITIEARFFPSATSGWYVTNMWYKD